MTSKQGYLVFDIGTGNARVAIVTTAGDVVHVERDNIQYETSSLYPDGRSFDPEVLWKQVVALAQKAVASAPDVEIKAVTATSQRQGIVLLDREGRSYIGLPNIDNRGREWEKEIADRSRIYETTGRLPSALFSAMKLIGLQKRQPELWEKLAVFTSMSEWVTYQLSGVIVYEPSQATETLLYDVRNKQWSKEICTRLGIPLELLPELKGSGNVLGQIKPTMAKELGVKDDVLIIVGGGDTQLAIESTLAKDEDVVIVSGTTTPICKITSSFHVDPNQRAWVNSHTRVDRWLLETNPGITGLNYQKLKNIFYPHESYQQMEAEMGQIGPQSCTSALGLYMTDVKNATVRGGFLFTAPIEPELTRAHFVASALWEIACTIRLHYDQLLEVTPHELPYVWACGGGLQSETLARYIANLLQKEVRIREGFSQASVVGAAVICNHALGIDDAATGEVKVIKPDGERDEQKYEEWKQAQQFFAALNQAGKANAHAKERDTHHVG